VIALNQGGDFPKPSREGTARIGLICYQIATQVAAAVAQATNLQFASSALGNDMTLVTHNLREFERIEGLKVEDWEES
jgi:tRNA(fMet)-specific endonuclease VapC